MNTTTKKSLWNAAAVRGTLTLAATGFIVWLVITGVAIGWSSVAPYLGRAFMWLTTAGGFWHTFALVVGLTLMGDYLRGIKEYKFDLRYLLGTLALVASLPAVWAMADYYAVSLQRSDGVAMVIALGVQAVAALCALSRHTEHTSKAKTGA